MHTPANAQSLFFGNWIANVRTGILSMAVVFGTLGLVLSVSVWNCHVSKTKTTIELKCPSIPRILLLLVLQDMGNETNLVKLHSMGQYSPPSVWSDRRIGCPDLDPTVRSLLDMAITPMFHPPLSRPFHPKLFQSQPTPILSGPRMCQPLPSAVFCRRGAASGTSAWRVFHQTRVQIHT